MARPQDDPRDDPPPSSASALPVPRVIEPDRSDLPEPDPVEPDSTEPVSAIPDYGVPNLARAEASVAPARTDPFGQFSPEKMGALSGTLLENERARAARREKTDRYSGYFLERDRARMEHALNAESAAKDRIPPPWNADQEHAMRTRGPIETFGSLGSIFGIIASGFTRTPMTSALNASAAAMTAMHQQDEAGYQRAYDAWKENTNLAIKRFNMERSVFEDTNKLLDTDLSLWKARTLADAARFDNQKTIALLQAGMLPEILELQAKGVETIARMEKSRDEIVEFEDKRRTIDTLTKSWEAGHPEATDNEKALHRIIARRLAAAGGNAQDIMVLSALEKEPGMPPEKLAELIQKSRSLGRYATSKEERLAESLREQAEIEGNPISVAESMARATAILHPKTGTAQSLDVYREAERKKDPTAAPDVIETRAQQALKKAQHLKTQTEKDTEAIAADVEAEHEDWTEGQKTQEIRSRLVARKQAGSATAQLRAQGIQEIMNEPDNKDKGIAWAEGEYDRRKKKQAVQTSLTPEGLELASELFILANPEATKNVGRGAQGQEDLTAIKNLAAKKLVDRGHSASEAAEIINRNTSALAAQKRFASQVGLRAGNMLTPMLTAQATAQRVIDTSKAVPRTQYPLINKLVLAAREGTGDPNVVRYGQAIYTMVYNYARAQGGGNAGLTVNAVNHAMDQLQKSWSQGQIVNGVDQLLKELHDEYKGALKGMDVVKTGSDPFADQLDLTKEIEDTMNKHTPQRGGAVRPVVSPDGWITMPNGNRIREKPAGP